MKIKNLIINDLIIYKYVYVLLIISWKNEKFN